MSHADQLIEIATELAMDVKDNVADLQGSDLIRSSTDIRHRPIALFVRSRGLLVRD